MTTNWQQELIAQYSEPCYADKNYTLSEMLDEHLAYVQHGMSNGDFTSDNVKFICSNGVEYLEVPSIDGIFHILITDLNNFDYYVQQGQSAEDFINTYWNYY
jgi:hypothetical protein